MGMPTIAVAAAGFAVLVLLLVLFLLRRVQNQVYRVESEVERIGFNEETAKLHLRRHLDETREAVTKLEAAVEDEAASATTWTAIEKEVHSLGGRLADVERHLSALRAEAAETVRDTTERLEQAQRLARRAREGAAPLGSRVADTRARLTSLELAMRSLRIELHTRRQEDEARARTPPSAAPDSDTQARLADLERTVGALREALDADRQADDPDPVETRRAPEGGPAFGAAPSKQREAGPAPLAPLSRSSEETPPSVPSESGTSPGEERPLAGAPQTRTRSAPFPTSATHPASTLSSLVGVRSAARLGCGLLTLLLGMGLALFLLLWIP